MKSFLTLFFCLVATNVFAERWIQCVDTTIGSVNYEKPMKYNGDCLRLGLCTGANNTGILENVFEAKGSEWNDASNSFAKCDRQASEGNRVIVLTAQEISDIQSAQNQAADSAVRESAKRDYSGVTVDGLKLKALVSVLIDEINILRQAIEDISVESPNITNKTLNPRTLNQAKTAILNKIDGGDVDGD